MLYNTNSSVKRTQIRTLNYEECQNSSVYSGTFLISPMFITIYLGYHLRRDLNKYVAFNDIFIGIFLFLGMDSLTVDPTGLYLCGLSFCLNAFLAIL